MNRQERRRLKRQTEEEVKIFKKLSANEKQIVEKVIDRNVESKVDEAMHIIDKCLCATLVTKNFKWKEVLEVQNTMSEFLIDEGTKLSEIKKENVDMAKLQKEVKEFITELIKAGKSRKEVVEEALFKFPKLSKSSANNAYGKILDEVQVDDAMEYIFEDEIKTKEVAKEIAAGIVEELEKEEVKEVVEVKEIETKTEEVKEAAKSTLKIKRVELTGEYGEYIKEGNVVQAGEITFNSLEELKEYKDREIANFLAKIKEIEEVYAL